MNKVVYSLTVKGGSHYARGIECQDNSISYQEKHNDEIISFVAVCDGHGGTPYVNSKFGSEILTEVSKEIMVAFIKENSKYLESLDKKPINLGTYISIKSKEIYLSKKIVKKFAFKKIELSRLINEQFSLVKNQIIDEWKKRVSKHLSDNPLNLTRLLIHSFENGKLNNSKEYIGYANINDNQIKLINYGLTERGIKNTLRNYFELYGSTLLCSVNYKKHTFLLQIGDGDAIIVDCNNEVIHPVPDFPEQINNITHSICEINANKYFTEYYTRRPIKLVLVATDGISTCFEESDVKENLGVLAKDILSSLLENPSGFDKEIKETLRICANEGRNKDDCSVAIFINDVDDLTYKLFNEQNEYIEPKQVDLYRPNIANYEDKVYKEYKVYDNIEQLLDKFTNINEEETDQINSIRSLLRSCVISDNMKLLSVENYTLKLMNDKISLNKEYNKFGIINKILNGICKLVLFSILLSIK